MDSSDKTHCIWVNIQMSHLYKSINKAREKEFLTLINRLNLIFLKNRIFLKVTQTF